MKGLTERQKNETDCLGSYDRLILIGTISEVSDSQVMTKYTYQNGLMIFEFPHTQSIMKTSPLFRVKNLLPYIKRKLTTFK
ncbi:hypothetical protein SAMN05444274_10156 [Mariniphaga anaerophila]|uniref:Uncharacterized protein n=1 Tax=Mariniphaga anaerophila TaxID=1484053 RepID=A0A1M4SK11_9BACT|nr:hypothetical protein SAMN05444274_10156 [Mariniphaga anaerophila]